MRHYLQIIGLLISFLILSCGVQAQPVNAEYIEVELVSERSQIVAGQRFWVALRLLPESHWHTYWRNPGDSGLETRINWQLPSGASAGPVQWPFPKKIDMAGIINFGLEDETFLLSQITAPRYPDSDQLNLKAKASWLVCKDICIPGEAELKLSIPYGESVKSNDNWSDHFNETRKRLPKTLIAESVVFDVHEKEIGIHIAGVDSELLSASKLTFFPITLDIIENSAEQRIITSNNSISIAQQKSTYFEQSPDEFQGVLIVTTANGKTAYEFSAVPGIIPDLPNSMTSSGNIKTIHDTESLYQHADTKNLLTILLFAFLGGLILNLMPCVFPVLSLKILKLINSGIHELSAQRKHSLFYTMGVVLSFVLVALVLLILRAAGESIGWGFQLQIPWFIAALVYVLFVLGLNLSGLLEFGGAFMGVGQSLTQRPGYSGSFFTGVLATIVATPCTAPFMGAAMGFAMMQTIPVALSIFAVLGLGLAAPFLVISFVPKLAMYLPKPGAWMNTFKQLMAFPLYMTVVWLLWVLGRQTDINSVGLVLLGLIFLTFAIWVLPFIKAKTRHSYWLAIVFIFAISLAVLILLAIPNPSADTKLQKTTKNDYIEEPFSVDRLEYYQKQKTPVFINFTADWCITCKVNEKLVLNRERVRQGFKERGVIYMKGDWTNRDAKITLMLEKFNRSGVPLYIVYLPGASVPIVLPQILTETIVLNAFVSQSD